MRKIGPPLAGKGAEGATRRLAAASSLCAALVALTLPPVAAASTPPCNNEAARAGASAALPDCRAYEQVSPVEKGGFEATLGYQALPAEAEPNGEALVFLDGAAFPDGAGNTPLFDAHLATREKEGWSTTELTPAKTSSGPPGDYTVEYAFSEDLTQAVIDVPLQQLTPDALPGMDNLFLRGPGGEYSLVNSATPLAPSGSSAFAGASEGFKRIIFESTAQYAADAPEEASLYESALEGAQRVVRLVGYLPNGEAATGGSEAGSGSIAEFGGDVTDGRVAHAISSDGSRIVFEAAANGAEPYEAGQSGMTEVYDRVEHDETVELSAPAPGAPSAPAAPAQFWAASSDGAQVFFTSSAELTRESNTDGGASEDLYEYDSEAPAGQRLRDLSVDGAEAAGARVLGVLGASEDGEYVYFVAEGVLPGGTTVGGAGPTSGEPNLYMAHGEEAPVFVATLSVADERDWAADPSAEPIEVNGEEKGGSLESYVAPDGRHVAFMSTQDLQTENFPDGYDNTDRITGDPDGEVYEYTAPGGEGAAGVLACASCETVAGAPTGEALIGGVALKGSTGTPFYQPRALSENGGRLFFTAPDAAEGRGVYEYERDGEGSCEAADGCTFAISTPPAGVQDMFLDASANGDDVFFATVDQLVLGDRDQLEDVYDARVEGGFASTSSPSCEDGCRSQGNESASGPAIVSGTTGSSGNLPPRLKSLVKSKTGKPAGKTKRKAAPCREKALRVKGKGKAARRREPAGCRKAKLRKGRGRKRGGVARSGKARSSSPHGRESRA